MSNLNPIIVLDRVISEYRSYLQSEFRAKDQHGATHPEFAYLHQSKAISHLLGAQASPVVVTTGTGSGKTEAFLLPVIQNAIEDSVRYKKPGLTESSMAFWITGSRNA